MMRIIKLLFVVLLVALFAACDTANNVDQLYKKYFIKLYGGDGDQVGVDMVLNSDNTITLLGNSQSETSRKIFFLKIDSDGNVITEKYLGGESEQAKDIEPLPGGGYIILSNVIVSDSRYDIKLIRTDDDGNKTDSIVYASLNDQFGNSVTPVSDGRFFVIGNTRDTNDTTLVKLGVPDQNDLLIIEFDNTLQELDTYRIGKSSDGMGIKIFENPNGSFTYAAYSDEVISGTSFNLNFTFRTFYHSPDGVTTLPIGDQLDQERMSSFIRLPSGHFFAVGTNENSGRIFIASVRNNSADQPVALLEETVGNGDLEGISSYPSNSGYSIFVLANLIATDGSRNISLHKVNSITGNEDWTRTFGSIGNEDYSNSLIELPNGDIMILGTVNLLNQDKLAIIKLNESGKLN